MAGRYWDTSALVKHYHTELGTPKVDALLQAPGLQHVISRLGVTETFSVFAGKVRAGLVTQAEFAAVFVFLDQGATRAGSFGSILNKHLSWLRARHGLLPPGIKERFIFSESPLWNTGVTDSRR